MSIGPSLPYFFSVMNRGHRLPMAAHRLVDLVHFRYKTRAAACACNILQISVRVLTSRTTINIVHYVAYFVLGHSHF